MQVNVFGRVVRKMAAILFRPQRVTISSVFLSIKYMSPKVRRIELITLDKIAAISQTIFPYEFSWMKISIFRLKFH